MQQVAAVGLTGRYKQTLPCTPGLPEDTVLASMPTVKHALAGALLQLNSDFCDEYPLARVQQPDRRHKLTMQMYLRLWLLVAVGGEPSNCSQTSQCHTFKSVCFVCFCTINGTYS